MGSVDPGFGTAYLARVVGEKKAREMWYLCRRYSAAGGAGDGPRATRSCRTTGWMPRSRAWCEELMQRSPTAIAIAKRSFNADSENIRGIGALGMQALSLYYATEELKEGVTALGEKRTPDFRRALGQRSYLPEKT